MILLRALRILLASAVFFVAASAHALENLHIFVFKQGLAQKDMTIRVGEQEQLTNGYGVANFTLPANDYEVSYYQYNGIKGEKELFALTEVSLLDDVSSQVFLNLKKTGADVELDLPLSSYHQDFEQQVVKKQEGPKGTLIFKVLDSQNSTAIANAKLFFKGYAIEAATNEQGIARLELSEGEYDISLIHPKYVMQVQKAIRIKANNTAEAEAKLIKADIVLDEFVVSAPFVEGSLASNIAELKDSDVVGDAISSEQFSKSGDSSAAGALKRVTGITVVDDKFVFVRGLGERYSTVLLNGMHVPSPEPTKRVVPLDIFPADVIQSMDIQKTYSSNLPGTFGGGTVLINTKGIPKEDNFIKGNISLTYNDATGDDVVFNGENDKPLPQIIVDLSNNFSNLTNEIKIGDQVIAEGITAAERQALDTAIVNYRSFGLGATKLKPGSSLSATTGQSFKGAGAMKYGFAGNIYYKSEENNKAKDEDAYETFQDGSVVHEDANTYDETKLTEKFGGFLSVGFEPTDEHNMKYTFMALSEEEDQTKFGVENDLDAGRINERVVLRYTEKELFTHQFNGEHHFGETRDGFFDDIQIDWGYSISEATRLEPGTFEYEYKEVNEALEVDAKKMFFLYSDLEDEVNNFRTDISLPFRLNGRDNYLTVGYFDLQKERKLDNRRFKVEYTVSEDPRDLEDRRLIDEVLIEAAAEADYLDIINAYREDDAYTAEQSLTAIYAKFLVSPINAIDISFGARHEDSLQALDVGIVEEEIEHFELETSDVLPFIGATYRLNDEHQFRLGYSQSLSRPDFREFSPTRYKDPETDYIVRGNPDLEPTEISNIDFKYEWFPSFDEFYTFGLFSKSFTNPIETVRSKPDEDIEITYLNAKSAESVGFELGFRKNLSSFTEQLDNYFVSGNYAYIDSEVEVETNASGLSGNLLNSSDRPMQGQSPYVVNLQVGYDNFFTRRSAILLYNVYGKRISSLGVNNNPDTYEQPFHRLDFVVKWGLNDTYDEQEKKIAYGVTLKLKNILDSEIEKMQGDDIVASYSPGRAVTLGLSMKF
ncbi:MAG: outer membrane receptor protein involved in Fe transport [Oleiphilaceae bacterium]|jgi:outer membrane receptor protein involved in Fe transport